MPNLELDLWQVVDLCLEVELWEVAYTILNFVLLEVEHKLVVDVQVVQLDLEDE